MPVGINNRNFDGLLIPQRKRAREIKVAGPNDDSSQPQSIGLECIAITCF
jgi:hypothetical protein